MDGLIKAKSYELFQYIVVIYHFFLDLTKPDGQPFSGCQCTPAGRAGLSLLVGGLSKTKEARGSGGVCATGRAKST